jgi:hypothetical protein
MAASNPNQSERVLLFTVDPSADAAAGALEKLVAYVSETGVHASLVSLDAFDNERRDRPTTNASEISGDYLFRAHSQAQADRFAELLGADSRVRDLYRPPSYRARRTDTPLVSRDLSAPWSPDIAKKTAEAAGVVQWGLKRCGFLDVLDKFSLKGKLEPIVMIDNGNHLRHPQLDGVISKNVLPGAPYQPSVADHSSSVAAIIAARKGNGKTGESMDGCCPAQIEMFNAWTTNDGLDQEVVYWGLINAIQNRRPVVNMSIWLEDVQIDEKVASLLDECEKNNVVVVAAIGNAGTNPVKFFPANCSTVIAVAATDPGDQRQVDSSVGSHAFIGAPGENIYTVVGDTDYDRMTGTSFAAPFVTAAVWLARTQRPELTPVQVRWLIAHSVENPEAPRNPELGFGRLDMRQLVNYIGKVPEPEECARFLEDSLEPHGAGV